MSHKYITMDCRNKIEVLHNEGYSVRKIAEILGYHHSSISRELKRAGEHYEATKANQDYLNNSKNKGRKSKLTPNLKGYLEETLKSTWSPEQIVGSSLQGKVSLKQFIIGYTKDI